MFNWLFFFLMLFSMDLAGSAYRLGLVYNGNVLDRPLWMLNRKCVSVFEPIAFASGWIVCIFFALGLLFIPWIEAILSAFIAFLVFGFLFGTLLRSMNATLRWILDLLASVVFFTSFLVFR